MKSKKLIIIMVLVVIFFIALSMKFSDDNDGELNDYEKYSQIERNLTIEDINTTQSIYGNVKTMIDMVTLMITLMVPTLIIGLIISSLSQMRKHEDDELE